MLSKTSAIRVAGLVTSALAEAAALTDRVLDKLLAVPDGPEARVFEAMRYSALAPSRYVQQRRESILGQMQALGGPEMLDDIDAYPNQHR